MSWERRRRIRRSAALPIFVMRTDRLGRRFGTSPTQTHLTGRKRRNFGGKSTILVKVTEVTAFGKQGEAIGIHTSNAGQLIIKSMQDKKPRPMKSWKMRSISWAIGS